ncbi:DNA-binding protein [Variovorax sp. 3P27G3]|uniref:DNA-binding protein n=1 Tax=Variovorax sp. 3P27G3 TaxID=2502214 RepID=UPI00201D76B7|nr:DNA-binding protein [Variovorax sp. 3P27G3]
MNFLLKTPAFGEFANSHEFGKNGKMPSEEVRTAEQVAAWFARNGITVTSWARENGFDPKIVYALLSGRTRGRHGKSHAAAVALGMKSKADFTTNKEHLPLDQ